MRYYTADALARTLGLTAGEVRTLTKKGVLKKAGNGLYILEDSARAVIRYLRRAEDRAADYTAERARFMRARRQSAEHELALMEKNLHRTEDVERVLSAVLVRFKARIRSIPARVSAQAAGMNRQEDVFDLLKSVTDEALQELSDMDRVFTAGTEEAEP